MNSPQHPQQVLPGIPAEPPDVIDQSHAADLALFEQILGDLPWSDTYSALLEEGWEWRKAAYIAWASLPATTRQPKTVADFAGMVGLRSAKAIRRWRMTNKAIDLQVQKLSLSNLLDSAPAVVEALIESASDSNYKSAPDRKLFFEMTGMYVPRSKLGLSVDEPDDDANMSDMSREDLARLAGMGDPDDE